MEIDRRFTKNKELYRGLAALEPRNFGDTEQLIANDESVLSKVTSLANVEKATLQEELVAFC